MEKNVEKLMKIKDIVETAADALNCFTECSHISGVLLLAEELITACLEDES